MGTRYRGENNIRRDRHRFLTEVKRCTDDVEIGGGWSGAYPLISPNRRCRLLVNREALLGVLSHVAGEYGAVDAVEGLVGLGEFGDVPRGIVGAERSK